MAKKSNKERQCYSVTIIILTLEADVVETVGVFEFCLHLLCSLTVPTAQPQPALQTHCTHTAKETQEIL